MMKKRIISTLLAICMLLTMLPLQTLAALTGSQPASAEQSTSANPSNPFSDVRESDWFYSSAMYARQNGLFTGISDTSFSPQGTMTRAMYVTVMGRIAGIDPADYSSGADFSDVPASSWYAPYVNWARQINMTDGVGNDRFDPDGLVTREQMAVLTVRFFDVYKITYPEVSVAGQPADLDSISNYAREAVLKLWGCGLFTGDTLGNFNPCNNATRAEAAAFCLRTDKAVKSWYEQTHQEPVTEDKKEVKPSPTGKTPGDSHGSSSYQVYFLDGDTQLDRLVVNKDTPLGKTPDNQKTAKAGYVFVGWFTDRELTTPFYAQDPVTANLTVYAKYEKMVNEEVTLISFAQMDQAPDLSFVIQKLSDDAAAVENAVTLTVMDGSAPVELNIVDNGDNTYTVSAAGGFLEGSSYQLTLGEGYIFKDKAESIRTASFSIHKNEVNNLSLNDDMIFIKDTEDMDYKIGDAEPVPVLQATLMNSQSSQAVTGTFDYSGSLVLKAGDILCIYETVDPRERDYINNDYSNDAEAYIEVIVVNGNTVTFTSIDETDVDKIVFMPDTIPFSVAELPSAATGTVESTAVDNEARTAMELGINPEVRKGDFLVFYVGKFADMTEESSVYYGLVTDVSGTVISYQQTTKEEIEKSMDTFLQQSQKGEEMLEGVDVAALTDQLEKQIRASGFAEDAAEYLALMATQTNGFKTLSGLTNFSLTDENGNPLTAEELKLMGIGANVQLSDKVKVKVKLDKSSKYFNDGIRLALGIDAGFAVDVGDDGELKIDLSATFVEEVALDITARAHAKVKWIILYPKFKELSFRTSVDIKNYAGISVDVKMYTVEKDEASVWDKLKGIKGGQYKEIIEQIEAVKSKIDQAQESADKIEGYKEDLARLWASVPANVTNKAEYEGMLSSLGELNVTKELMGMLNLTSETELDAGVRNLMERYAEMLENESDWIELVHKEIFHQDIHIFIFAIGIGADFVIKGNVNIALGANMEYVVGKRYSFWFDIVSKTSGSSEMDLLDEKFAFQFYVMGQLGLKMGVEAEICAGIISTKIGSIGFTAEFGPYVKMWGYFVYEYTKLRPANTTTWNYNERMMGALYLEFGLYLEIAFKAQVLGGLFKYQPTLLDKEWPLLTAGTRYNVYGYAYKIDADEVLPVKDQDSNSANGITMILPESYRLMSYIDLCEGNMEQAIYDYTKYNYNLSNRNFTIDKNTGMISVNVPKDVQYMECDLTLTWKSDKLAFSRYDLAVTIPLVWSNLSTEELKQRFTASVRAGNANDGYTTVWTQRVVKNAPFDLPKDEDIRKLLSVDSYGAGVKGNLKYASVTGYGQQSTEGLTILQDTSYYFEVTPRTYTLTVKDVQKADGSKENRQFTARFGEAFDLSSLQKSGTNNGEQKIYTTFLKIATQDNTGKEMLRNVTEPIGKAFAMELLSGATYTATYADNSAAAIFQFEGVNLAPIEVKMKKGDVPSSAYFEQELGDKNAIVKSISPAFAPITGATAYTVVCEVQQGPVVKHTITYNSNGGSVTASQTYSVGSVISKPADPEKDGFSFDGWFSDEQLQQAFTFTTMPDQDLTLYAKWSGQEYTVTFDVTEGNPWSGGEGSKTVTSGEAYGILPVPVRPGWGFSGWYTARVDGDKISADTIALLTGNQTLFAHWNNKAAIDQSIISFAANQVHDYNKEHQGVVFATGDSGIEPGSFTVKYKRQNLDSSWGDRAVNAGTYDVKITRAEDDSYRYFEKTFVSVMTINKIARTISANPLGSSFKANLLVHELSVDAYPGDGTVEYAVAKTNNVPASGWQASRAFMNLTAGNYYLFARVREGENYWATTNTAQSSQTVTVEGINADNTMDYVNYFKIKTSDIKNAGTDSEIRGRFHYLDGTSSALTHFDKDGYDDFEKGDLDSYTVDGLKRVPWMIKELEIDYTRKGTSAGWHCAYVQPFAYTYRNVGIIPIIRAIEGSQLTVNQWFGAEDHDQSHVVWKGTTNSMQRKISGVGNFADIPESLNLDSGGGVYAFTYDGLVNDQYGYRYDAANKQYVADSYNAYDYLDAPALSITASNKAYNNCISYTINSFTVDKEALYAAMQANGDNQITLTATLQFPERSTTANTAKWSKTITVRLAD